MTFFPKSNELKPHSSFDSVTRPRYNATFGFERFEGRLEICQNPHCLDGTKQAVRHADKKESKIFWLFTELPICEWASYVRGGNVEGVE